MKTNDRYPLTRKLISSKQANELIEDFKVSPAKNRDIPVKQASSAKGDSNVRAKARLVPVPGKIITILILMAACSWLLPSGGKLNLSSAFSFQNRISSYATTSNHLMIDALSEIHQMPKFYTLEWNNEPTPTPDKDGFYKAYDDQCQNYDDSPIDIYKDATIEVKCWKEKTYNVIFNYADIKIIHPTQFRRKLTDDTISSKHLDYPLNLFKHMNGVVGMSSDYCAFRNNGTIIHNGKIFRKEKSGFIDLMIYDKDGNLSYMRNSDFIRKKRYLDQNIIHTFAFGPMLVDNYEVSTSPDMILYRIGQVNDDYPRAAIGQFGYDKHYLLCTIDYPGLNVTKLATELQKKGVRFAYNMDGGQTATLMFNSNLFNNVAYGGQREVSDILFFATALPND